MARWRAILGMRNQKEVPMKSDKSIARMRGSEIMMGRRRALQQLGLFATAAYAAPVLLKVS
jgi:hypothetical protein